VILSGGAFAEAEPWLRRAAIQSPYDSEVHWALNQSLQGQGKTQEAKAAATRAQYLKDRAERISAIQTRKMTEQPRDARLQAELGELLLDVGQRDSGERWLLSALQIEPGLLVAHAALARYYESEGVADRAQFHRRQASGKEP
jgi:Tfp pilus assembly protein PilF